MILDLAAGQAPAELSCDLCVVGAGAAGLAIASELLATRLRVVLLESGGMDHESATQALYDVALSGLPHPGSTEGRFRICGGSTTKWGGQALPLMAHDFERREWVSHSGWPLTFEELRSYYARACQFLLVDSLNFDTDLFNYLGAVPPAFDRQKIWYHFSKWSPQPSVRERHLAPIRASEICTLLLHANVTQISLDENLRSATTVQVRSLSGAATTIRARAYVVCAGGIETARILLANNRQQPRGIGNQNDLVGRFFQDHPSAKAGMLHAPKPSTIQRLFNVFHRHHVKYSVRCTAAPGWQQQQQTLNSSMGITFESETSAFDDLKNIYKSVRQRQLPPSTSRTLLRVAAHPSHAISPVWQFMVHGRTYTPGAAFKVRMTCEQEPNPESRILLSEKTDALGMPLSDVRWQLTQLTWHTMHTFATMLQEEFRRVGLGEIELDPWVRESSNDWPTHITDQFHHMGTTRMHDSPREGVVDRDCRIHGMDNLYIGSSSVFPTSGHSNPTLTVIALCLRLSDLLKRELG